MARPLEKQLVIRRACRSVWLVLALCLCGCQQQKDAGADPAEAASQALTRVEPRKLPSVTLTADDGSRLVLSQPSDAWTLVFFGFTHCPDVCPAALGRLRQVWSALDSETQQHVRAVFVSVDPARDTPERLKDYLDYFGEFVTGATGSADELKALTNAFGTSYQLPRNLEGSYAVGHPSDVFLLDSQGVYVGSFSHLVTPGAIAAALDQRVK